MEWTTTSTILEGLADHDDRRAWQRFVVRFRSPVVRFARGMGLAEVDAEDVAQETLIAFANALREGEYERSKGRLSHFLFGIAHRQAMNRRRREARDRKRQNAKIESLETTPTVDDVAADQWNREWEHSILEQCMKQVRLEVSATSYQAFELAVRDQKPATEVAELLNIPVKTVYNAKHRILKRIRQLRCDLELMD